MFYDSDVFHGHQRDQQFDMILYISWALHFAHYPLWEIFLLTQIVKLQFTVYDMTNLVRYRFGSRCLKTTSNPTPSC